MVKEKTTKKRGKKTARVKPAVAEKPLEKPLIDNPPEKEPEELSSKAQRGVKRVNRELSRLRDPEAAADVLKALEPQVEEKIADTKKPRKPGATIRGNKVPWRYSDWMEISDVVTFTPMETMPICLNGVRVQLLAGITMHVAKPFYDRYEEVMRAKSISVPPPELKSLGIDVELGAGALIAD